jgi:hypothetical protein
MNKVKVVVLFLIALPSLLEAQSFYAIRRNRELILNVGSGTANYRGELVNPHSMGKTRPNIVVGAEYFFKPRIAARAELTWFQIAGTDKTANDDRKERNLSFRSNNWELSVSGVVNLTPTGSRFYQRSAINFYGFAGIALLYMNPKAELDGKWHALQPLQTENVKYSRFQPVIPYGLGVKIKSGPFFNVLIEGGYRLTFTDYLDDMSSHKYVDPALLKSDLSRTLADRRLEGYDERGQEVATVYKKANDKGELYKVGRRGNPEKNDGYFLLNVKIQYYLPYQIFHDSSRKLYNQKRKAIYRKSRRRR